MPNDPFYYSKRWRMTRSLVLRRDRWICQICQDDLHGRKRVHVDHVVSRRRAPHLAYVLSNLRTLCEHCHNRKTSRDDGGFGNGPRRGTVADTGGVCVDGLPRSPDHPWSQK